MKVRLFIAALACAGMCSVGANAQKQVIFTGDIASKVIGYNGTTPLNITIENGVITDIEALDNEETPRYFKRVVEKIFPQYIGKTVAEAMKMKVDAVSGATYSSEAVLKNISMGLEQAKKATPKATKKSAKKSTVKKPPMKK